MPAILSATHFLDRDYLLMRSRILDLAGAFDRMASAGDAPVAAADARATSLRAALGILIDDEGDKSRRVQMVFSDPYQDGWRS